MGSFVYLFPIEVILNGTSAEVTPTDNVSFLDNYLLFFGFQTSS